METFQQVIIYPLALNFYATDGLTKRIKLEITSTLTFTSNISTPTVKFSSIEYLVSSGLDKLRIKSGTTLECRFKNKVALFSVDATHGFNMWTD